MRRWSLMTLSFLMSWLILPWYFFTEHRYLKFNLMNYSSIYTRSNIIFITTRFRIELEVECLYEEATSSENGFLIEYNLNYAGTVVFFYVICRYMWIIISILNNWLSWRKLCFLLNISYNTDQWYNIKLSITSWLFHLFHHANYSHVFHCSRANGCVHLHTICFI